MDFSNRRSILMVFALVSFILGAVASEQAEEILLNALTWVAVGLAFLAGALL